MVITEGMRLPAGGIVTTTFRAQVDSGPPDQLTLTNTACVTATNWLTATSQPCDDASVRVVSADLAMDKTDSPDPVLPGSPLTYTLTVVNNGPSEAENVVVTDTLPTEVEFARADPTQTSGPNPLTWDLGTMASGQELSITVVVTVSPEMTEPFTNTALVGSDTSDPVPENNEDEESTRPPTPKLELVKTVEPSSTVPDMPFTYTLRIDNTGDFPFNELWLTDTLPSADFYYVAGSGRPTDPDVIAEPLLVWPDLVPLTGPLVPGASLTVTYQVTTPLTIGSYTNTATVEGVLPDGSTITDTDEAVITVSKPAVDVDKRITAVDLDDVAPNYITFTIAISNSGPSTIDVLPLADTYDTFYLSFVDATPYPEEDDDDGLLVWRDLTGSGPYGFDRNLPPGDAFEVTTVFRIVRDIDLTINTATVTGATDIYGNPADPAEDDVLIGGYPTAIELLYFRAQAEESAVRLEWATAAEIDCEGFRVYRALEANHDMAQGIAFIPAEGPESTYVYIDRDVAIDRAYWYWLAEVSASEPEYETLYGPVWGGVGPHALPVRLYLPVVGKDW
jgi:uncharacterized repeat protein (TIGR01451 family)